MRVEPAEGRARASPTKAPRPLGALRLLGAIRRKLERISGTLRTLGLPAAGHEQAKRVEWLPGPEGNTNFREANFLAISFARLAVNPFARLAERVEAFEVAAE